MKLIYLVLDGAADSYKDASTSYSLARKPYLDLLARAGVCGMMYTIGRGIAPESDGAVLSILGFDPHKYYTGRGPLEALGAGLDFREGYEVAFRANFATLDPASFKVIDRRVGRSLTTHEARELAKAIDNMELGKYGGYSRVVSTIGHRAVVVIGSREFRLSDNIDNTDPAYRREGKISVAVKDFKPYIKKCVPLDNTESARITAELVNLFTAKAVDILENHPVNIERSRKGLLKANSILLRDAGGSLPKVQSLQETYSLSFGAVVEMPVERGIAKLLGMKIYEVEPPSDNKEKDYRDRLHATLALLKEVDVVYVHLKGPDEPGHDGDKEAKVRSIEMIDKYYVKPLL